MNGRKEEEKLNAYGGKCNLKLYCVAGVLLENPVKRLGFISHLRAKTIFHFNLHTASAGLLLFNGNLIFIFRLPPRILSTMTATSRCIKQSVVLLFRAFYRQLNGRFTFLFCFVFFVFSISNYFHTSTAGDGEKQDKCNNALKV